MRDEELILAATLQMEKAYSPYSGYQVGAALLCADDSIYTGCNIENISFGGTICAERTAFVKAISENIRDFVKIAICASGDEIATPCGICRQFAAEFCKDDFEVICANHKGDYKKYTLGELLPHGFYSAEVKRKPN